MSNQDLKDYEEFTKSNDETDDEIQSFEDIEQTGDESAKDFLDNSIFIICLIVLVTLVLF